jgi:hypothetical protein
MYNPKDYLNERGLIDFSKAQKYDEDVTRSNLIRVNRQNSPQIVHPVQEGQEEIQE